MKATNDTAIIEKANRAIRDLAGVKDFKFTSIICMRNGGLLMELNREVGVSWIMSMGIRSLFTTSFGATARIKPQTHNIVVHFVPFSFRAGKTEDLREIEEINGLDNEAIIQAKWIKPIERRSPTQSCGHVILALATPESANEILVNGVRIAHKLVTATKCKKEPFKCLKCHGWNHVASECIVAHDTCGTCGGTHRTSSCDNTSNKYCTPCAVAGHASWDRECPSFKRKCDDLDARTPENNMPYFPTNEEWTHAILPTNKPPPPRPDPPHPNEPNRRPIQQSTINFSTIRNHSGGGDCQLNPQTQNHQQEERQWIPGPHAGMSQSNGNHNAHSYD
jgi:hypothetical protein